MTLVEGDPKAPFSLATTLTEGAIPWITSLNPYFIMLSAKQDGIKYHILSLV